MSVEVRRMTIELPVRSYNRLVWLQGEIGAGSMVEVIRHALMAYEEKIRAITANPTITAN